VCDGIEKCLEYRGIGTTLRFAASEREVELSVIRISD
jgi:hypothetical protein